VPVKQGWDIGYDAQWYYFIAADPLGAAIVLDRPAFRYQRILFPVLIRVLSLGRVEWMPWVMLGINLASACLATYLIAELLAKKGASSWYALVFSLSFGFLLAMRLDLLEPLVLILALGGWKFYTEDKPVAGIVLFALSGLTKEIGLVFPAALTIWLLLRSRWRRVIWLAVGSFLPYILWGIVLFCALGTSPESLEATRLSWLPFSGLFAMRDAPSILLVGLWVVMPAIVCTLYLWVSRTRLASNTSPETVLVLAQVIFVAVLPQATWADPLAVLRTGLGMLAAILLWLASAHRRALPFVAALFLPSGLLALFVPGFV
jgi:hypothetical protein